MIQYNKGIYNFYVYIITNKHKTVLYTGVTNNLKLRLQQHKNKKNLKSFTAKYNVYFLVYYQHFSWIQQAIAREKEIKNFDDFLEQKPYPILQRICLQDGNHPVP